MGLPVLAVSNAAALAAAVAASAALGGRIGPRSAAVDTDLTPASPAFSIWGLIYALLGVLAVVQLRDPAVCAAVGPGLPASLAATAGWLLAFTLGPADAAGAPLPAVRWASLALLVAALAPALAAAAGAADLGSGSPARELGRAGLSLYAGWLAVAAALGLLAAAAPVRSGAPARLPPPARYAAWAGLAAALAAAGWRLRDPLLLAPLGWAALWRAARGDQAAAVGGALAWAAALAVRLAGPSGCS